MNEEQQMDSVKGNVKLWQGILMLGLGALVLYILSPILQMHFGLVGNLIAEWLLVVIAIVLLLVGRSSIPHAFPIAKPKLPTMIGVLLIWGGTFWIANLGTQFLAILFPEELMGLSSGLGSAFSDGPFLLSVIIIAITPAICEEIMFRGIVLNSMRSFKGKWIAILISAVLFGIFHGSVFRFIPPTLLGIAMGYIFMETGNMLYTIVFHFINNMVPLIILYSMQVFIGEDVFGDAMQMVEANGNSAFIASFGSTLMFSGVALFFIYIGRHLLHKGQPGYECGLFPKEKQKILFALVGMTVLCFVVGMLIMMGNVMSMIPDIVESMPDVM